MRSVALIGPDGAGKTTLSRMLQERSALPFKYLYMGINIEASNAALPTARLAESLKRRMRNRRRLEGPSSSPTSRTRKTNGEWRRVPWRLARLVNRLADEWYRQLLAWVYQLRGFIVLYDRYFRFDFSRDVQHESFDERLHRFLITRFYPRPDMVIYLDAPAEVLYARKGEKDIADLESRRQAFLCEGSRMQNFVVVNATQPLEMVYAEVEAAIAKRYRGCSKRLNRTAADAY